MPVYIENYTRGMTINSPVYLDANFTISCHLSSHPKYIPATSLLFDLFAQQAEIYISTLTVDEMWWGLLCGWHDAATNTKITARKIKSNPSILNNYHALLQNVTSGILNWTNTTFLPTNVINASNTIQHALDFLTQQNIQPRDSFHLALATLSNAAGFVTSDSDFDNITLPKTNLTRYKY